MNNYFSLPEITDYKDKKINFIYYTEEETENIIINKSLNSYLKLIKQQIDDKKDWDKFKRLTYIYEYISTRVKYNDKQICCYEPISRAFFKLYEIIYTYKLIEKNDNAIKSFHLAEGPGGFIECVAYYRKNKNDEYYGITLIDSKDKSIPNWDKCNKVMRKYNNIKILNGPSGDGDLLKLNNLKYINKHFKNTIDFVTGDGGIDYSENFNKQEQLTIKLIIAQVIYALFIQKEGGNFVLKIFDCFYENTINILYLLGIFYENVKICKPDTSRTANSERYIVCKNFRRVLTNEEKEYIYNNYEKINTNNIKYIIEGSPRYNYITKIEEINSILGQQQLENINLTLNNIFSIKDGNYDLYLKKNKEKINSIIKKNITKCIKWCTYYGFNYNNINYSKITD